VPSLATAINDRYELTARLGRGGMADVYRATDLALEREVAVKVIRGDTAAPERRFDAEVSALARLSHPGIVRLYDGGTVDGQPYLVMELVEGQTLADVLTAGPLPPDRVRCVGRSVAEALAHAHRAGLVHRDVKPANVLVPDAPGAAPRLTDFGIARLADETMTATVASLGTAAYLAPEQLLGGHVGPAADVYSLGLVRLECLTAQREYRGSVTEAAFARLGRDPTIPANLPSGWPDLLRRMTAREPEHRPTAAFVAAALAAPDLAEAVNVQALPRQRRRTVSPSARVRFAGAGVATLLLGAGGLFAAAGEPADADQSPEAVPTVVAVEGSEDLTEATPDAVTTPVVDLEPADVLLEYEPLVEPELEAPPQPQPQPPPEPPAMAEVVAPEPPAMPELVAPEPASGGAEAGRVEHAGQPGPPDHANAHGRRGKDR
jgi:eukaryotic-like serine/threonine-protein kinase